MALLPSSFDNIMTTLLFGKQTLRFDEVIATLLMNETREVTTNSQMMVRWPQLQKRVVRDEDGQERMRNGPNIQDQVVGSLSVIIAMRKVI